MSQPTQPTQPTQRIGEAVRRWEAIVPETPAPPIMGNYDRVLRIVYHTGKWPHSVVKSAEQIGLELPEAREENVHGVNLAFFSYQIAARDSWNHPIFERRNAAMTDEEKSRPCVDHDTIVDPAVFQAMRMHRHTPVIDTEIVITFPYREPNQSLWITGEAANGYVRPGERILFLRQEEQREILNGPHPRLPKEMKNKKRTWQERDAWLNAAYAAVEKHVVNLVYEHSSRRCVEGEIHPLTGRRRWPGEWVRESHVFLKDAESPVAYTYDAFAKERQISMSKAVRQDAADVAFVLMHQ